MQKFMLGAYWDARPESLEQCSKNAGLFFERLAEIDSLLSHWYERGRSRNDALEHRVDTCNIQMLQTLLLKGRNRRDIDRDVINELGFSLSLWNGADKEEAEASVSVHCGAFNERIGNSVIVNLPYQAGDIEWFGRAKTLLTLVAEVWHPKWGGIMSKKAMRERDFDGDHPFVDWMVYVPRSIESIPLPGWVEALDGLGSIVVVQPNPPMGNGAEELSHIRRVEGILTA